MLHNDQRISQIAQVEQRFKQFVVISLMQTDTGFIEDIQNSHQRRANLRCKTNSLRLTAGKRTGRTRKRQVFQTNAAKESETRANLLQNLIRNDRL